MQFRDILISPLPLNDPHNPQIDLIYVYPMTEIEISLKLIIYTLSPYHVWGSILPNVAEFRFAFINILHDIWG